ncbi:hypothetical protein MANES_03G141801v8 [Manihot esculenta]|uniref:Uncharacterized protein n=1 Tax=Manihot esculenta TaxID=3983 RepID=A0A2C9W7C8_MANES|nr:hypothetical protein MANES_03G141801v8 [Manihot esculenta]
MLTEEREHNPPLAEESLYFCWECALPSSVIITVLSFPRDHSPQTALGKNIWWPCNRSRMLWQVLKESSPVHQAVGVLKRNNT